MTDAPVPPPSTELFPDFYANPAIRSLAPSARWSISGPLPSREDSDDGDGTEADDDTKKTARPPTRKAPIDIQELRRNERLRGAWSLDEECLMSLDELVGFIPNAGNHAFYLRAQTDGLMVVDIEPDCPTDIAANLLDLDGIVYSELSMSGRGYHLLVPLPANFYDFPNGAAKKVLREEHGWYELLLEHWVTFTRWPIEHPPIASPASPQDSQGWIASLEDLYARLAEHASAPTASSASVALSIEAPDIPDTRTILLQTTVGIRLRDLSDFAGDTSRWEFSVLGSLYGRMHTAIIEASLFNQHTYSASDHAWLLYQAATEVLPARAKHTELRNGRPFLLDRAAALVAERRAQQEREQTRSESP